MKPQVGWYIWTVGLWSIMVGVATPQSASHELSTDQRLIEGLRQRGLFDLADRHCRNRLGQQPLTPDVEVSLIIELMRTQMSRAMAINDFSQRAAAWEQSRSLADDFLAARPDHPQALLA
ncbi:MAG TPA: hypothetical protein PKD54_14785, partial [Pirellulaceae bacterium]|nr:hypothetical protein [Pirellulaceae bacterium]